MESDSDADDPWPLHDFREDVEHLIAVHERAPDRISGPAYVELCLLMAGLDENLRAEWIYSKLTYPDVEKQGITQLSSTSVLRIEEGERYKESGQWRQERTQYRIPSLERRRSLRRVVAWPLHRSVIAEVMEEVIPPREEFRMPEWRAGAQENWLQGKWGDAIAHALVVGNRLAGSEGTLQGPVFARAGMAAPPRTGTGAARLAELRELKKRALNERAFQAGPQPGPERARIGTAGGPVMGEAGEDGGQDPERAGDGKGNRQRQGRKARAGKPDEEAARRGGNTRAGRGQAETGKGRASKGCEANRPNGTPDAGGGSERSQSPRYEPNREQWKMRGTRAQRRFLDERVRIPAERLLFLHLLGHALKGSYEAGEDAHMDWITVPAEKMERKMGAPYHATYLVWRDSDLVECYGHGYYVPPGEGRPLARKFRIPREIYERWTELGDGPRRYWLHTADPVRTSPPAAMRTDLSENGNRFPVLVDRALRVLAEADHRIRVEPIREAIRALARKEGKAIQARKLGLQQALETIERQTTKTEEGVAHLQNAYTPTFGGRIVFKRGGPQGMLGAVKARAYDIEGLRNYDIKCCHTTGLKEVAGKLAAVGVKVDVSPWEEYPGKYEIADQTGLPVVLVKIFEHAIKYGAYLPASIDQARKVFEDTDVDPEEDLKLVQSAKKYAEDPDAALGTLHGVFGDMRQVVKKISRTLLNEYWEAHKQPGGPKGFCMNNACGVTFRPGEFTEGHERETKVMAWMLQGLEAAFVHSITILSAESSGFSVIANEHDGLIVEGAVPEAAVEVARIMSGFHRAELEQKPHADEQEIQEVYGQAEPPADGSRSPRKHAATKTRNPDEKRYS